MPAMVTRTTDGLEDRELAHAFESCTLPPSEFTHRNHVRIAWLYLRDAPLLEAVARFRDSLQRYAASVGAAAKYHETITFAFVFLIHERMQRSPLPTFDEFAGANPDLLGPVLERYYRPETLASDLARRTFLMPDTSPEQLNS
jgi:hypothetical protein